MLERCGELCRRAAARSEAAKDAEAEYTAKQLQQHLPVGPQYLSREELIQQVKPTDAELALCSLYSNRSDPFQEPSMVVLIPPV